MALRVARTARFGGADSASNSWRELLASGVTQVVGGEKKVF